MPYHIIKRENLYCIQNIETGDLIKGGCHDTRQSANNHMVAIMENENTKSLKYCYGSNIKSLGDNRIGGYLVNFTDTDNRDLDNEYFTQDTDLSTPHNIVGLPLLFHHGLDKRLRDIPIGEFVKAEVDNHGLWVEALIRERDQYEKFVNQWYQDKQAPVSIDDYQKAVEFIKGWVNEGKIAFSSGANPNTAEIDEDGHIKKWAIFEGSATHTPADPNRTKIYSMKSILDSFDDIGVEDADGHKVPEIPTNDSEDLPDGVKRNSINHSNNEESQTMPTEKNVKMLTEDEIAQIVNMVVERVKAEMDNMSEADMQEIEVELVSEAEKMQATDEEDVQAKALAALIDKLPAIIDSRLQAKAKTDAQLDKAFNGAFEKVRGKSKAGSGSHSAPRIEISSNFSNWTPEDFSFAADLQQHLTRKGASLPFEMDDKFYREFADKATKAHNNGEIELTPGVIKSVNAIKADEVMYSTQAGYGDEHVPTAWRDEIWRKARRDNVILPLFNVIDMPTNPYILPIESSDPTVYKVAETADQNTLDLTASPIPDSKIATTNVTMTAAKLGLLTFISGELAEDSVSGAIPMYRAQAERAMLDAIDNVLANGDTATSLNINDDGGTPAATAKYLVFNGLLKNAIVTATTNAVDASGTNPTLAAIRNVRFKLDRSKQSVSNLAIIVHPEVEAKLLNMDEFITMDKAGTRATNMTGQIGIIDGIPVFVSNEIALADSDGKITNGGNVVERGRLAIVHRPSWYVGYRRRVTTTLEYRAALDVWTLTSTLRLAFVGQDNDSVSVLYNIGV